MSKILMEKDWLFLLEKEFEKPYMQNLKKFLLQEKKSGQIIYPPSNLVFNAFLKTSFKNTKVVIIGQDPYHGEGQAHGLSFSVKKEVTPPPSLKNIFKELFSDLRIEIPKTGFLLPWAIQGVLLLNATLTVRKGCPKSHFNKGWEQFTDKVVEILASMKKNIVFLLWGRLARDKCVSILNKYKENNHLVLEAAHPSFYSAHNFFGCRHFSKTNNFLKKTGQEPIDWKL